MLRCSVLQLENSIEFSKLLGEQAGRVPGLGRPTIRGASSKILLAIFRPQISPSQFRSWYMVRSIIYGAKHHWLRQVTELVKVGRESTCVESLGGRPSHNPSGFSQSLKKLASISELIHPPIQRSIEGLREPKSAQLCPDNWWHLTIQNWAYSFC